MGKLNLILIAALLALPLVQAQVPDVPGVLRPTWDDLLDAGLPVAEETIGADLQSEDISITVVLEASNVEYQVFGIMFGGGKVQADVSTDAVIEFRAVSTQRVDQALEAVSDGEMSLNKTFGVPTWRTALTAEEIRLLGTGVFLEAFMELETQAAKDYLEDMVPGLRIVDLEAHWSNLVPATWLDPRGIDADHVPGDVPLREPPLRLDIRLNLQYLERISLYEILQSQYESKQEGASQESDDAKVKRQLEENQTLAFQDRNAFQVLGFGQLLALDVPPGLRLDVTFKVPQGYTIEGLTDELVAADGQQAATFTLDGRTREDEASLAGVVTVSSRNLVTSVSFGAVLLVGVVLRILVELGMMSFYRVADKIHKKYNPDL